eukprot:TRINITY_DN49319_c0_g1_i1.p1 TRINITY_DN49319_c0_g1~~TRINITY_DN49319_c0_g1_i1.p1  ORF type:complete len:252 (+),score=53.23 TRINITY_DN49319_c0_g1_i1:79-756(+)
MKVASPQIGRTQQDIQRSCAELHSRLTATASRAEEQRLRLHETERHRREFGEPLLQAAVAQTVAESIALQTQQVRNLDAARRDGVAAIEAERLAAAMLQRMPQGLDSENAARARVAEARGEVRRLRAHLSALLAHEQELRQRTARDCAFFVEEESSWMRRKEAGADQVAVLESRVASMEEECAAERKRLEVAEKRLTSRYANLFGVSTARSGRGATVTLADEAHE